MTQEHVMVQHLNYLRGIFNGRSVEAALTTRQMMDSKATDLVPIVYIDTEDKITKGADLQVESAIVFLHLIASDERFENSL
jgi:hypothetical protein